MTIEQILIELEILKDFVNDEGKRRLEVIKREIEIAAKPMPSTVYTENIPPMPVKEFLEKKPKVKKGAKKGTAAKIIRNMRDGKR